MQDVSILRPFGRPDHSGHPGLAGTLKILLDVLRDDVLGNAK